MKGEPVPRMIYTEWALAFYMFPDGALLVFFPAIFRFSHVIFFEELLNVDMRGSIVIHVYKWCRRL